MPAQLARAATDRSPYFPSGRSISGWYPSGRPVRIAAVLSVGLVLFALLFARNPYLLSNPQMWTEDLLVYFLDDLLLASKAILIPYNGTIQLAPRLVAWIAGLFPTALVPTIYSMALVFAVAGMVALTCVSTAFRGAGRGAAVLLIFLVPVGSEVFLGMAYIQWILGPAVALALYERAPGRAHARGLLLAYAVVAFSSPIGAMAIPFALIKAWRERSRFAIWLLSLSVVSALFMAGPVVGRIRAEALSAPLLDKLRAGLTVFHEWATGPLPVAPWTAAVVSTLTIVLAWLFLWHHRQQSQRATLYFLSFGFVILTGSLAVSGTAVLQQFGDAERYFYIPALLFLWTLLSLPSGTHDDVKAWTILLVCVASYLAYVKPATVLQSDMHWRDIGDCVDRSTGVCVASVNPPYLGRFLVPSRHRLAMDSSSADCCLGYRMNGIVSDRPLVRIDEPVAQLPMPPLMRIEQDLVVPVSAVPDTLPYLVDLRLSDVGDVGTSVRIRWKVFRRDGDRWQLMHDGDQHVSGLAVSRSLSVPVIGARAGETLRVQLTLDRSAPVAFALFATAGSSLRAAEVNGQPLPEQSLGLSVRYK